MKVSSDLADYDKFFVGRVFSWVCKEQDVSPRDFDELVVTGKETGTWNAKWLRGGRGVDLEMSLTPFEVEKRGYRCDDPVETMVSAFTWMVVAHRLWKTRYKGQRRPRCYASIAPMLKTLRENRAALFESWCKPEKIRPVKPKKTKVQLRAEHAAKMLAKWERNLKLAKTKIKVWAKKVAYYDKKTESKS
jgi:hypothetical protein